MIAVVAGLLLLAVTAQAQEKCCLPKESSMVLFDLGTVNGNAVTQLFVETDSNKMQGVFVNQTWDPYTGTFTPNYRVIVDYKQHVAYIIPANDPESTCYKVPYNSKPLDCIPDDAQYLGTSYLGPVAGGLYYDGFRFPYYDSLITIAVSLEGCVPIALGFGAPSHPEYNTTVFFSDFVDKIVDPSLFELPLSCNQTWVQWSPLLASHTRKLPFNVKLPFNLH